MENRLAELESLLFKDELNIKSMIRPSLYLDYFMVSLSANINDSYMLFDAFVTYDEEDKSSKATLVSFEYGNDINGYMIGVTPIISEVLYQKSIEAVEVFIKASKAKKSFVNTIFCF
jgi:hypothetical protein